MGKKGNIRSILGLTQLETAILLKVPRSKWSHYERHTRDLPPAASLRLHQIIKHMLSEESKQLLVLPNEDDTKKILDRRIKDNNLELMKLERKIEVAQQKFEKYEKVLRLLAFLNSPKEREKELHFTSATNEAATARYRRSKSELKLLQIDRQMLEFEQTVLQKELQKIEEIK